MSVLGMNERNGIIIRRNPRKSIRLVNDKYKTKCALAEQGVPVPGTVELICNRSNLNAMRWEVLPDAWALKPNAGRRGEGILLAVTRDGENWRTGSGRLITREEINLHTLRILDGEYSLEGMTSDIAMFEPLIRPHRDLVEMVPEGLPDCRIICLGDEPLLAMMRIPTRLSQGKANLHQGAIGGAVDIDTGRIHRALFIDEVVTHHPDTGVQLIGREVPLWDEVMAAASRCSKALNLGYIGCDIVIDEQRGPLVLECNAFPGLAIQNVNARGIKMALEAIGQGRRSFWRRFVRRKRPHAHRLPRELREQRLGKDPVHMGLSAHEAAEPREATE